MLFSGTDYDLAPAKDEVEVTIIGPGYGEAICIHIGDGRWILVDSCRPQATDLPCALAYLADIGADLSLVAGVVISHWDDDHVRGLGDVIEACPDARVIASNAFKKDEFHVYAAAHKNPLTAKVRAGVKELRRVFELLGERRTPLTGGYPDRQIWAPGSIPLSHGADFSLWTLSPSDAEYENFLTWLSEEIPEITETRRVSVPRLRNDLSTVVLLSVGDIVVLLGGDLEEHRGKPEFGWSAILSSTGRHQSKASLFKIAHHGSLTGHHDDIWTKLLESEPVAVLAPWKLGGGQLPKKSDVERILALTPHAHSTATVHTRAAKLRDSIVKREIKATTKSFRSAAQIPGMVRFRRNVSASAWSTEHFGAAVPLARAHG
ncbi:MBL fold metallo-hydrolase [Brevundimonas mediterranea]|nr:MBL fold metallo-hydrolase [Brevundimonas mediterranea]